MSAGVDREPPEPPNTSRTSPRTPRTGGIHKGLNYARIVSKHGSLNRRLPPHARRKQEARSLNVKRRCEELALTFSRQPQNTTSPESLPRLTHADAVLHPALHMVRSTLQGTSACPCCIVTVPGIMASMSSLSPCPR
ncbi:uncharacterized protein LOC120838561 isoform X3 [Ixodes scapularis]|uniref:uncharacterized protein LOC120838561 isoform X3 n=1 Tax=Ixodes scapularis TaxID=6945 RepID=UPI001A9EFC13|nr:uncharacterized protein LOC120838561 isoform X3 [Ixodes scapularis]